jgi:hypothetical protein
MPEQYPAFSAFRELLTLWDECLENQKVERLMDDREMSFFFKKDGEIFGAPEESRLVFARMKDPSEDGEEWVQGASFPAYDLKKAKTEEDPQRLFTAKDLKSLEIIDKEDVLKSLKDD